MVGAKERSRGLGLFWLADLIWHYTVFLNIILIAKKLSILPNDGESRLNRC